MGEGPKTRPVLSSSKRWSRPHHVSPCEHYLKDQSEMGFDGHCPGTIPPKDHRHGLLQEHFPCSTRKPVGIPEQGAVL